MTQSIALLVNALGWTLLHSVWQGAVIGLLFLLSRSVLGSANPAIRHTNALAWLILFVSLPVITFVGLLLALPGAGAVAVVPSMLPNVPITQWPVESARLLPVTLSVIGCLWLSGVMVLTVRLFGEWHRLENHTCFDGRPLPRLDLPFAKLRKAMKVRIDVGLVEAAHAMVPMVVGFLRPVIVLPSSVLLGLTPRELELIIAHELAHLRRKDHLTNYLLITAETLLFFHPVIYLLTRTIRHERELCCDDLVITTFNERVCYAHALSKLEAMRSMDVGPVTSLRLAAADGPLVTRIARMVSSRTHRRWGVMPAAVLPFVAATFALGVFHQAHVAFGHGGVKKASKSTQNQTSGTLESKHSATTVGAEETELQRVRLPYYPRRSVAAATVSQITLALTRAEGPQPLSAIEKGVKLSYSRYGKDGLRSLSARQIVVHQTTNSSFASSPDAAAGHAQIIDFKSSHDAPTPAVTAETSMSAHATTASGQGKRDISAGESWPAQSAEPIKIPGARELTAAYIPTEANALFDGVTRQAGLPALPSYRPELPAASTAFTDEKFTPESMSAGALVESGGALIHRVTPRYPSRARSRGLVEKVVVSIDVDASGNVNNVSVINSDSRAMFQRSVMRAVTQWQFEPLLRNGVPVERTVEQSFDFRLEPLTAKRRSQRCRDSRSGLCRLAT